VPEGHTSWEELRRELQPGLDEWRRQHPWRARRTVLRMKARTIIYKLTRIDIG
jgi:hypothetical protein